jgi:hypothetical protein
LVRSRTVSSPGTNINYDVLKTTQKMTLPFPALNPFSWQDAADELPST